MSDPNDLDRLLKFDPLDTAERMLESTGATGTTIIALWSSNSEILK